MSLRLVVQSPDTMHMNTCLMFDDWWCKPRLVKNIPTAENVSIFLLSATFSQRIFWWDQSGKCMWQSWYSRWCYITCAWDPPPDIQVMFDDNVESAMPSELPSPPDPCFHVWKDLHRHMILGIFINQTRHPIIKGFADKWQVSQYQVVTDNLMPVISIKSWNRPRHAKD